MGATLPGGYPSQVSTNVWHPFADMSNVAGDGFVIVSGHGCTVRGEDGRDYLDATAGLWYCNVGHGRTEIGEAVAHQMGSIAAYSNFGDFSTRPTIELANRLSAMAPMSEAKVFFTSGGSDSVDTAVKMVRRYWEIVGKPERQLIVTRTHSYHGMHVGGTLLSGIVSNRAGYGFADDDALNVVWNDADALATRLDEIGPDRVAAFFCEPVIGAGGVYTAPTGYLEEVREICRSRDVLFVADEVITGFGRTGRMFASSGLDPDIVLTAKGLTSGYLPMGAVLVGARVSEPFFTTPGLMWRHGYTYSGHASTAVAASTNLDIVEREDLVAKVADSALSLTAALLPLRDHDLVTEVRSGSGLLAAVQLDPEAVLADPTLLPRIIRNMRENGVLTRALVSGAIQVSPPFVVTRAELRMISGAIDAALVSVGSRRTPVTTSDAALLPDVTSDEAGGFGNSDAQLLADVPPHHGT
jgi:adenosylmethionine-8-amino-7-oxononanoate aminotransferase